MTRVPHTLWLDKPLSLSEFRHADVIFTLHWTAETWMTSRKLKKAWLLYKTNRKWLSCLRSVIETFMTPFQQEEYQKKLGYTSCFHWAFLRWNDVIHVSITARRHSRNVLVVKYKWYPTNYSLYNLLETIVTNIMKTTVVNGHQNFDKDISGQLS